jgi:hypothetical protein
MFSGVLHCRIFTTVDNPLSSLDEVENPLSFLGSPNARRLHDSEPYKYISWHETASLQPTPTSWCDIHSPVECNLQSFFAALVPDNQVFGIISPFGSLARLYLNKLEASTNIQATSFAADLHRFASDDRFRGASGRLVSVVANDGNTLVTAASLAENSLDRTHSGISDGRWVAVTVSMNEIEATITEDMNFLICRYPTEVGDLTTQLADLTQVLWPYVHFE